MPIDQVAVLVGVAVLAVFAMAIALVAAWFGGRRRTDGAPARPATPELRTASPGEGAAVMEAELAASPSQPAVDRVVRIVVLLFLAAVALVVSLAGLYADRAPAIYLLLAVGTFFVALVGDLLPARLLGTARYSVEAIAATAFLTVLVGLTDGLASPFFVGFFLLVGGASLSVEGLAPMLLAILAAASYAVVVLLEAVITGTPGDTVAVLAWTGFDVAALLLLAYIATVAGRQQRRAREAALRLSRFDPLTGLYNRGYFFAAMEREIRRVERTGRGFCVLMLDLDDLKPVNDTFGHQVGDRLLRAITEVLMHTIRATDTPGRYGGDEFMVLLPETDPEGAFVVAEKLRRDVGALSIRVDDRSVRTSVSLGLVAFPEDGDSVERLLSAVDAAMYEAKRRGKNQIVGYTTRTERVATAIGAERPTVLRPRGPRVDESRAAEVGVPARPAGSPPPRGDDRGEGVDGERVADAPDANAPDANAPDANAPEPGPEDAQGASIPRRPAGPGPGVAIPVDESGSTLPPTAVPVSAVPRERVASAVPPAWGAVPPPVPRSLPRVEGSATGAPRPPVAPGRTAPGLPGPAVSGPGAPGSQRTGSASPPTSPARAPRSVGTSRPEGGASPAGTVSDAPWQTRSDVPIYVAREISRSPLKPAGRQYVVYPVEPGDGDLI